jgi:hypothetical protein
MVVEPLVDMPSNQMLHLLKVPILIDGNIH